MAIYFMVNQTMKVDAKKLKVFNAILIITGAIEGIYISDETL